MINATRIRCTEHMPPLGDKENAHHMLAENMESRYRLEDLRLDARIILILTLKYRTWTGFILTTGSICRPL
jgi:hypothetical protein